MNTDAQSEDILGTSSSGDDMSTDNSVTVLYSRSEGCPNQEVLCSDVTVYEGENAEFSCKVCHEDEDVSWFINNSEAIGERIEVSSHGLLRKLLLKNAKLSENGTTVSVKIGDHETSVHLEVKVSHFSTHISDVMVMEGDTAVFSCEVRNITDTVQWFINGNTISNDVRYTENKDGRERELRIHHCTLLDNETQVYVDISDEERRARLYVGDVGENKRRWLTVGIALHSVLCIPLRKYVHRELRRLWQSIESSDNISRQACPPTFQHYLGKTLNYQAINGNESHGKQFIRNIYNPRYDFAVKTLIDFAKLFLPSSMSHMTGFDNTCDISAVLNLIGGADLSVKTEANKIREEVRNPWGHCNFMEWGSNKLKNFFSLMCDLVKRLGLDSTEENEHLRKLDALMKTGPYLFDGTCGMTLIQKESKEHFMKEVEDLIASSYDIKIKKSIEMCLESINMRVDNLEKKMVKVEKTIHAHIPAHIQEQFNKRKDDWISQNKMFVSTHAAKDVMTKIKEHNFVVVTGNSGTGKTYLVRHTALMMEEEGYILVPSVYPEDIRQYFKHGCKTVFVFDDLCGRFTLNQNYLDQWKLFKQSLETILKDKCCKILASCRLQVFIDKHMTDFISEIKGNACELGSRSICLSLKERKKLVKKYLKITVDDEKISEFEFLPFLCSMLIDKNKSEIENCFRNPFYFFENEFKKLYEESDEGKLKYSALIICVLYNNKLTQDDFTETTDQRRSMFRDVLKECKLPRKEHWQIQDALEDLRDVFIVVIDNTYKIIHDKLFDFMAKYFGEMMIDLCIKFADSDLFAERFCITSMNTSKSSADFIDVPDDKINIVFERMVTDWKQSKVMSVFRNTNLKSVTFRRRLLSHLQELDESLQRDLVQEKDNDNGSTPLLLICFYGDIEFAEWILNLGADVNLGKNDNKTPLHIACMEGYNDMVKFLLKFTKHAVNNDNSARNLSRDRESLELTNKLMTQSVDVNKRDENGVTPLMIACFKEQLKVVKELLQCEKIDIDLSSKKCYTALYLACVNGNTEIVAELIKHSADISKSDEDGLSPLMVACNFNQNAVVKELLKCEQIDINQSNNNGVTALYLACIMGNKEIVTDLLKHSVDINKSDEDGESPLFVACKENQLEVVKELLRCERVSIDKSTNNGCTALIIACVKGSLDIVADLIEYSADINKSNKDGHSPLMIACNFNQNAVVKELLKCEQIDINQSANNGVTALYLACIMGNKEIVTDLLKHSVDINKSNENGVSPLIGACKEGHLEVVRELLKFEQINIDQSTNNGCTALYIACVKGSVEIVAELIQHSADINKSDEDGESPLFVACKENQLEVVKELLRCERVRIDQSTNNGCTALLIACVKGSLKIVADLIEYSADINKSDKDGHSPLMMACNFNQNTVVKDLLKCEQIDINQSANNGVTALYLACIMGNKEIVTDLLKYSVDINKSAEDGESPLFVACLKGNVEIVTELLQHSADINKSNEDGYSPLMAACNYNQIGVVKELLKCEQIDINQSANNGVTALYLACIMGNKEIVTDLLKHSVDINKSDEDGVSPLIGACKEDHLEVVEELLKSKQINIDRSTNNGYTALHIACVTGSVEIVTELLQHSADINKSNEDGYSPLMAACNFKQIGVVKELLKCEQIDINQSNNNGVTALYLACIMGNKEIVTDLLKHSVDINKSNETRYSPLMAACNANHIEVVKELLKCEHIDVNLSADDGSTALYIASEKGNVEIVAVLIQNSADTNKSNMYGISPLMIACRQNHTNVIEKLLSCQQTDIYQRDNLGYTAFCIACEKDNELVVSSFIKYSVDTNIPCKGGWTPLIVACYNNKIKSAIRLLQCEDIDVDHRDIIGKLHFSLHAKWEM